MTAFRQFGFQFYANDAVPNFATPLVDENTNISRDANTSFRVRIGIHNMNPLLTSTSDQITTSDGKTLCVKVV